MERIRGKGNGKNKSGSGAEKVGID